LIDQLSRIISRGFDLLLLPLSNGPRLVQMFYLSVLSGLVMLKLFGWISNQAAITTIKRALHAGLLEMYLYRDRLSMLFRAAGKTFLLNGLYFSQMVLPLLFLLIPCVILLAQFNLRYDAIWFRTGESAVLRVNVTENTRFESCSISVSEGIQVESKPVRVVSLAQLNWRLRATQRGRQSVIVTCGSTQVTKIMQIGRGKGRLVSRLYQDAFKSFLYPGARQLDPAGTIKEIRLAYPRALYYPYGIKMHWLALFLVVSIGTGWLFKGVLRVEL